jgi:Fe-S-cluster containining protein
MEHIAQELGIPTQVFMSKYVRAIPQKGARVLQNDEDDCPFLSWDKETKKGTCTIYVFRPQACRNWLASLARPECREGLCKLRTVDRTLFLDGLYSSRDEAEKLCSPLTNDGSTEPQQV